MRNPNTECYYCKTKIYRRPFQIKKQKVICCNDCRSIFLKECAIKQQQTVYEKFILDWKSGNKNGMKGKTSVSSHIRKYLFEKYNNKCCKCGWSEVHFITKKIPLEINHIDGNYKNNKEDNLELLCPNCHSLTSNYRSLNIGNGRLR